MVALGDVHAGVFTNSNDLWKQLNVAGEVTSDTFWRMPLHKGYLKEMQTSTVADFNNLGKGRAGGACSAAAFLKEFVAGLESDQDDNDEAKDVDQHPAVEWAHIDIAGVMDSDFTQGYHIKGMSGKCVMAGKNRVTNGGLTMLFSCILCRPTYSIFD